MSLLCKTASEKTTNLWRDLDLFLLSYAFINLLHMAHEMLAQVMKNDDVRGKNNNRRQFFQFICIYCLEQLFFSASFYQSIIRD